MICSKLSLPLHKNTFIHRLSYFSICHLIYVICLLLFLPSLFISTIAISFHLVTSISRYIFFLVLLSVFLSFQYSALFSIQDTYTVQFCLQVHHIAFSFSVSSNCTSSSLSLSDIVTSLPLIFFIIIYHHYMQNDCIARHLLRQKRHSFGVSYSVSCDYRQYSYGVSTSSHSVIFSLIVVLVL